MKKNIFFCLERVYECEGYQRSLYKLSLKTLWQVVCLLVSKVLMRHLACLQAFSGSI